MGLREYTTAPPEQAVSPAKAIDTSKAFFKGCMFRTSYLLDPPLYGGVSTNYRRDLSRRGRLCDG
jgi:hypothetical protein